MAEWAGRLLLLGAVGLWWGGHVGPQLFSLAFPALLAPDDLLQALDPELDEGFANALSAATLLIVALLALANAIGSWRRATGRTAIGGWILLAATAAAVAVSEMSDAHNDAVVAAVPLVFGAEAADADWARIVLLSPLLAVFGLAMWVFVRRGLRTAAVRAPFVLGIGAWLLAAAFDATQPTLLTGQDHVLGSIVEEMLEVGGALLIGLSAAIALRGDAASRSPPSVLGPSWRVPLVGSIAVVVVLGSLAVVFTFRVLLIDARAVTHLDTFELQLRAQEAVVQEVHMPAYPIGRLDFRLVRRDPNRDWGVASVRMTTLERPERLLAEYQVEVPTGETARWRSVDLIPPIVEPEGQRLAIQLFADIAPDAELRVGVTTTNRYGEGRLWVNGAPGKPAHDLEFVAYGAPEPTRSKLQAIWHTVTSDWRWSVSMARMAVGLTLIVFFPVVLVTAAFRRSPARGGGE